MTTTLSPPPVGEAAATTTKSQFARDIDRFIEQAVSRFDTIVKSYVTLNMAFAFVGVVEFLLLILFFSFLAQSAVLAMCLAIVFLTVFSYFTFRLYYNTRKPEQLIDIRDEYIGRCKAAIGYQEGVAKFHMALANASCKLAAALHGKEYHYYPPPLWLEIFAPTLETFSCWWHWQDLHKMKEILLLISVDEHIKLVKCEPTNLEVHAALANAYVMLSSIYSDPRKTGGYEDDRWVPLESYSEEMRGRFRGAAERAIEEFKILNDYAPNDPWVHAQLAYSYHDLQMPAEEIKEYEIMLRINPDDKDTLFKLGMLYFQEGQNAKGLKIYEELKGSHYKKAEQLIKFYGAYRVGSEWGQA